MKTSNRRDFLKKAAMGSTLAGAGLTAAGLFPRRTFSEETSKAHKLAYRKLGSTGFDVTEIGFGAMNTRDAELITAAIDAGINYIDTANGYMKGVNEEIVGKVMLAKRDKVFLTTKVGFRNVARMPGMIETSLKRLKTDHVDLLLAHMMEDREGMLRDDVMKVFDDARAKGQTRFVGVSTHKNHAEVLDASVESKFWEAVLVGYNHSSPPNVTQSIEKARNAGLAIIAMKTIKGEEFRDHNMGDITTTQAALKWVLQNKYVDTIIPGMESFDHLEEDLSVMGMKISFFDHHEPNRYSQSDVNTYCRGVAGCTGCTEQCPKGMELCELNRCIRYADNYGDLDLALDNYMDLPRSNRIDICEDCDECLVKCAHGLNLTEKVRRARELFT